MGENSLEDKIIFNVENIDIEDIIKQIHSRIEKRGYNVNSIKNFNMDIPQVINTKNRNVENVDILYKKSYIQYWWPLIAFPGLKGKIKNIIKKVVRKLTFFYMQHVIEQQNEYNLQVTNIINIILTENEELKNKVNSLNDEVTVLKKNYLNNAENPINNSEYKFDYHSFENRFRGSVNEIKNRQRKYVDYFINKDNVLDIGCGRGEFLELLSENNIKSMGMDLSSENVEYCIQRGLNVTLQDGIDYLESCEDDSIGGIFAAQVIEHISNVELIKLLNLAYKKLKKNSCIILETLNPKCLMIYAESFYMDPSHSKPVHPDTLQFMAEEAGYQKAEIIYMTPSDELVKIPYLKGNPEINDSVDRLNKIIYGEREYALVAKK